MGAMDSGQLDEYLLELKMLVLRWRDYVDGHHGVDEKTRQAGYMAGLSICANQLDEVVGRIKAGA